MTVRVMPYTKNDDFLTDVIEWGKELYREKIAQGLLPEYMDGYDDFELENEAPERKFETKQPTHEELYQALEQKLAASRKAGFVPHLVDLSEQAGLDAFERKLLALLLLPSLGVPAGGPPHPRQARMPFVRDLRITSPSVGELLLLLCNTVAERRVARRYFRTAQNIFARGLLVLGDSEYASEDEFLRCDVTLPRRIFNAVLGETGLDEVIFSYAKLVEPEVDLEQVILHADIRPRVEAILTAAADPGGFQAEWRENLHVSFGHAQTVLMIGPAGTGKNMLAHAMAKHLGKRLLHINYQKFASEARRMAGESPMGNVLREAWLQDAIPFFDECQDLFERDFHGDDFLTNIEYQKGLILFATNEWVKLDKAFERRMLYRLEINSPDPSMRSELWKMHLPGANRLADGIDVRELGLTYELNGGNIKNAVLHAMQAAIARTPDNPLISHEDLQLAAEGQLRNRIDGADAIIPKVGMGQIVLPAGLREQIDELISVARSSAGLFSDWGFEKTISRGSGLTVLFRGEPGTGKTITAEAIAHALGRTLYKVDSASLYSMWVGETEKNVKRLFDSAKNVPAVILFDEADSLFGRRSENPQGGSERMHNNVTNLLLQKMEEFNGLVILTTNLAVNLDPAFERRLSYRFDFPLPGEKARTEIWRTLIPADCPLEEPIDFEALGRGYSMSGGYIKNAVLRAARLRYAKNDGGLRNSDLIQAAELESHSQSKKVGAIGFVN